MGRSAIHTEDDFIDAAIQLFATHGQRAVTMGAVARELGASNGSIYHRFPDRITLLSAVWLRTSKRMQLRYRELLGEQPTPESATEVAVWLVEWCRDNLAEAQVLQAGARAFGRDEWSDSAKAEFDTMESARRRLFRAQVQVLAARTGRPPDQIAFVLLELPLAVVRPKLLAGRAPTEREAELVRGIADLVLAPVDVAG
ncbi:TetR/AcrR family transcriptional regulator [Nocardia sp. NPDC058633]|uniref:TetR/AcrR family transcriptional regulator n=1 Tax=Nocardia sp. NPDC058633 TaxID=3346568 RepID=UPI003661A29B